MKLGTWKRSTRGGFTLIELLVVIAIMAILAALISAAVVKMLAVQPIKNTQMLIIKLKVELEKQWRATVDLARDEPLPPTFPRTGDPDADRARYVKERLMQEFPCTVAAATTPTPGGLPPKYASIAGAAGLMYGGQSAESSACLFAVLKQNRGGSEWDPDSLSPREQANAGSVKIIIDHWKTPLQFKTDFGSSTWTIRSFGPNKIDDNDLKDDITSANLKPGDY